MRPTVSRSCSRGPSWLISCASLVAAVAVLLSLSEWRSSSSWSPSSSRTSPRILRQESSIDDDITRDDTCRDYLMNFLNGTTDAKDECQAMSKAWQVADCVDYNKNHGGDGSLLSATNNHTNSTDDVLIDDAFEKWECCNSISDFYGKHCEEKHWDSVKLLGIVMVLIVCGVFKSILRNHVQYIPDAGACIIVGAIVGGILRLARTDIVETKLLAFDNDLFLQIMLPPIVFEAALTIDKRAFQRDFWPIMTFAILGTFLSALMIGYMTFSLSSLPLLDSLLFGALMSSIDPVATLGILTSVGLSQGDSLYTIIFGESLLNDGVAIVLFDSLVRHMGDADVVDQATISDTLWHFLIVTFGSILVGAACGAFATTYFYALMGKQSAVAEVGLFFAWALVPYYIADGIGLSGIIAIMVMGFMMDWWVIGGHVSEEREWMEYMEMRCDDSSDRHPVQPYFHQLKVACYKAFSGKGLILSRSRHHVGFVAEVISTLMETAIFAYLGLFLFNDRQWQFGMTFSGIFACISSRAGMVVALSLLINFCVFIDLQGFVTRLCRSLRGQERSTWDDDSIYSDTRVYLDVKTQLILFSAGIRGAVSYVLVQNIPVYDAVTKHGSLYKAELRSMTSATIVVILFSFGALTYFTVQRDIRQPESEGAVGSLHHRLLSISLASDEGNEEGSELNSSLSLEIEGRPSGRGRGLD